MTKEAKVIAAMWKIHNDEDLRKEMVVVDSSDQSECMQIGQVTKIANQIIDIENGYVEINASDEDEEEEDTKKKKKKKEKALSPHYVGQLMHGSLQLEISPRTNKGYFVKWDQVRMEALAKGYGIKPDEIMEIETKQPRLQTSELDKREFEEKQMRLGDEKLQ
jgi:hypothetical protein